MQDTEAMKAVAFKIHKVMTEVTEVAKITKSGVNYSFQAWADVLPAVRAALIKHGLVIIPSMGQSDIAEWQGANSKSASHNVPLRFQIIDTETGACITAEWSGEARDVSDKGKQKAATSGMKYFLLKLLMIPEKADVEHDEAPAPSIGDAAKKQTSRPKGAPKQDNSVAATWLKEHGIGVDTDLFKALKQGGDWREIVHNYLDECKSCGEEATIAGLGLYVNGMITGGESEATK